MIPNPSKEWLLATVGFAILVLTSLPYYLGNDEHTFKYLWKTEDSLKPENHADDQLSIKLLLQPEDSLNPEDNVNYQAISQLVQQLEDSFKPEDHTNNQLNIQLVQQPENSLKPEDNLNYQTNSKLVQQPEDSLKPEGHTDNHLNIKQVQQPEDSLKPENNLNYQTNSKLVQQPDDSLKPEGYTNNHLNIKLVQQPEDSLKPEDNLNYQTNSKLVQQPEDSLKTEDHPDNQLNIKLVQDSEGSHKSEVHGDILTNSKIVQHMKKYLQSEDYETTESLSMSTEEEAEEAYNYIAAVVEFRPYGCDEPLEADWKLQKNTLAYIKFAKEAKIVGSDIIVFPEYGLTGTKIPKNHTELITFSQIIPDPSEAVVPCDFDDDVPYTQILKLLSCAVKDLKMYMVLTLIEQDYSDKMHFYNTQIVLDRQGAIIARYRKIHLYTERQFTAGPVKPETAMFTTDFGVTFSLMVCFDILYEYPGVYNVKNNGVKHVIMSTAWMDQLPFLAGIQVQSGWAEYLGVNLLVANLHIPEKGATGSGIYQGNTDKGHHYIFYSNEDKLITTHLTNNDCHHSHCKTTHLTSNDCHHSHCKTRAQKIYGEYNEVLADGMDGSDIDIWHGFKYEYLPSYSHVKLSHTSDGEMKSEKVCHNDEFCCNVDYTWSNDDINTTYMMLAYDGNKEHARGLYTHYYQICSIVHCSSDDVNSCAYVAEPKWNSLKVKSLYALFNTPHVFPSMLNQNLTLSNRNVWSYENQQVSSDSWEVAINIDRVEECDQLLALNLYGRIFELDSERAQAHGPIYGQRGPENPIVDDSDY